MRRTHASERTLIAFGLAGKRRIECARVDLSWCLVFHNVTAATASAVAAAAAAAAVRVLEYVSTERSAQSTLLLVSRPKPAPADCSLVTERCAARRLPADRASGSRQRCYTAVSSSKSSTVPPLLLAVVDNILDLETMPCSNFNPSRRILGQYLTTWALGLQQL